MEWTMKRDAAVSFAGANSRSRKRAAAIGVRLESAKTATAPIPLNPCLQFSQETRISGGIDVPQRDRKACCVVDLAIHD